jgi:hypothetical protein
MQRYGFERGVAWCNPTRLYLSSNMSATVLLYTSSGFVVAADGRGTLRSDSGNTDCETDTLRKFEHGQHYVEVFTRALKRYVGESKRDGVIDSFPEPRNPDPEHKGFIFSMFIVGYFEGRPFWINTDFFHRNQKDIVTRLEMPPLKAGQHRTYGSAIIPTLIEQNDPRFCPTESES